jgi:radical SAM superfamily enzyme
VAYLLKEKTVEPEKHPLLGNGCVTRSNGVTVGGCVFCVVRAKAI